MDTRLYIDDVPENWPVSTGHLPPATQVDTLLAEAHTRFKSLDEGKIADYIPALAATPKDLFGICVVATSGDVFSIGDTEYEFSIQSISKPFVFALVSQALSCQQARYKIGVNATGLPFNSVMAIELNESRTMNPMVNAGAIATTSLVPGATADEKWQFIHDGLSRLAGRRLTLNTEVYESEAASNQRNQGIAHLLEGYGRMYFDPLQATDVYTKQCSLNVSVRDLAVMGATLADGGGYSMRIAASAFWLHWRPPGCMRNPATGCTKSDCLARAALAAGSSPWHRARAASPPSPRSSIAPETASRGNWSRNSFPNASA